MARPPKRNAEYFPHPADRRNDPRIKSLRRKFDHLGYSIYTMLREMIAASPYFHLRFDSDALEDVAGDVMAEPEIIQQVALYCVQREIFKQVNIGDGTFLIDPDMVISLSELLRKRGIDAEDILRGKYSTRVVSAELTTVSATETPHSLHIREINPQSKVKRSKVKRSSSVSLPPQSSDHGKKTESVHASTTEGSTTTETNKAQVSTQSIHTVDGFVRRYLQTSELMLAATRALANRGEDSSAGYIERLLNSFAPKFAMEFPQGDWNKFRFRFSDFVRDQYRKPLVEVGKVESKSVFDVM